MQRLERDRPDDRPFGLGEWMEVWDRFILLADGLFLTRLRDP